jgi:hypothetical protein
MSVEQPTNSSPPTNATSQLKCAQEAVVLLNCLAAEGAGKCDAQTQAFIDCTHKARLQKFVLVEECSPPKSESVKPRPKEKDGKPE